jgi:hypothetical protein
MTRGCLVELDAVARKARPVTGWRSLIDWESTAQATSQHFQSAIEDDIDTTTNPFMLVHQAG